jgi:cephalosporin-C deacetylase
MKKLFLVSSVLLILTINLSAQNFLSPVWKISFTDTAAIQQNQFKTNDWKNVNLLLSWERQGFFGQNGKCCLANNFCVPDNFKDSDFTLTLSLQCNIESIYVNGKYIGGNLPNQFWINRGTKTVYQLPKDCIVFGANNAIRVFASELSYTGGKSYNYCTIVPSNPGEYSGLKISVPAESHLFSIDDKNASINLEYKSRQKGSIELFVVSDFHDTLVHKIFNIDAGDKVIPFNFTKEIHQPGIYECTAIMKDIGFSGDVKWFALSPEKIICGNKTIPQFKKYWETALDELKTVNPEFSIKKVDSLCTSSRDGYIAEMKSLGNLTIRGYYFVPRTAGKHKAVLHVPGYGYGFDGGKPFLNSNEDIIEFAICVRGHGISADVFNPGFGVPGIWGYKLYSEKENAYRSIYMDCVRAVEFLLSRPEVDTTKINVIGGSQGGGLTLAAAALCSDHINACAYFDPFPCDIRDQLKIRTLCNTEIKTFLGYYNNECSFNDALNVQDLLDTKGFADWIKCPTLYVTGLFDDDCPPHVGFAAYNRIKSTKQFKIFTDASHLELGEPAAYGLLKKFVLNK